MQVTAKPAAAPGDGTPGSEEPALIKMNNQHSMLDLAMPINDMSLDLSRSISQEDTPPPLLDTAEEGEPADAIKIKIAVKKQGYPQEDQPSSPLLNSAEGDDPTASAKKAVKTQSAGLDGASTITEACDHPHAKRVELPLPTGLFSAIEADGMVFFEAVRSKAPEPAATTLEPAGAPRPVAAALESAA